jgi:pyrroline-5-carboxylate reductase
MKIGVLGVGKIGEVLLAGLVSHSKKLNIVELGACVRNEPRKIAIANKFNLNVVSDPVELLASYDWIVLCVKPHQVLDLLQDLSSVVESRHRLVSVCASINLLNLKNAVASRCPVVRAMPNTPSQIGLGMTLIVADQIQQHISFDSTTESLEGAQKIFSVLGETLCIDEKLMDVATALSGCGPAYVYLIIEALSDAGVALGLSRDAALKMVAQTMYGASKLLLETGLHPAQLRDQVTTPGGVTIDGLMALEKGNLRSVLSQGVMAAASKAQKLSQSLNNRS